METKTIYIYELGKNQQEKTIWKSPIYARERKNPYEREKKERKERKENLYHDRTRGKSLSHPNIRVNLFSFHLTFDI
jgi:hypothetical protein